MKERFARLRKMGLADGHDYRRQSLTAQPLPRKRAWMIYRAGYSGSKLAYLRKEQADGKLSP